MYLELMEGVWRLQISLAGFEAHFATGDRERKGRKGAEKEGKGPKGWEENTP